MSIRYCAYAPRATALRACDVLRLVQGCPRLNRLSWFCDEEFQEGTLLLRGVCNRSHDSSKAAGGASPCSPLEPCPPSRSRFDEGEIDEARSRRRRPGS